MERARKSAGGAPHLAQVQAVPRDHKPLRLPTFPAIERTSLAKLTTTQPIKLSTASDTDFMMFRGLRDCLWRRYTAADGALAWRAYWYIAGNFGYLPDTSGMEMNLESVVKEANFSVPPTVTGSLVSYPKFIDKSGNPWFYNPAGGTFSVELTFAAGIVGGAFELYVESMDGFDSEEGVTSKVACSLATPVIKASITAAGWFRVLKLALSSDNAGAVNYCNRIDFVTERLSAVLPVGTGSWLPVLADSPEFANYKRIYSDSRCNATSYLFQNTTAVLNKEGSVEAVRVPVNGAKFFTTSGDTALLANLATAASSERYVGLLEKGFYTFVPPDIKSANFQDWTSGIYEESFAYVQMVRFTDYGESSTSMMLSWDFHIEFRNNSMLWDIGISPIPLEDWHRAQVALASIPFFYENFIHLSMIASAARAAAARLAPVLVPIAKKAGKAMILSAANQAQGLVTSGLAKQAMAVMLGQKPAKQPKSGKKKIKPTAKRSRR